MLNFKKLSQALLLAVGLAFASGVVFYSSSAIAKDEKSAYEKGQDKSNNKKKNEKAKSATAGATLDAFDKGEELDAEIEAQNEEAKRQREEAERKQQELNNYKNSEEYKQAQQAVEKVEEKRREEIRAAQKAYDENISNVKAQEDKKVADAVAAKNEAQRNYDACLKAAQGGCSNLLAEVTKADKAVAAADKARTEAVEDAKNNTALKQAITDAQNSCDEECERAYKQAEATDKKIEEYENAVTTANDKAKKAEQDKEAAKRDVEKSANDAIKAAEEQKQLAQKEYDKAKKDFEKQEQKVTEACSKNPDSNACKNAMAKLDEAKGRMDAAKGTMDDADQAKRDAQDLKNDARREDREQEEARQQQQAFDDLKGDVEQRREAEKRKNEQEQQEKQQKKNDDRKLLDKAKECDDNYNAAIDKYNAANKALEDAQRKCQTQNDQNACKQVESLKKAVADAKGKADAAYRDKQEADKNAKNASPENAAEYAYKQAQENLRKADEAYKAQYAELQAKCEGGDKNACSQAQALKKDLDDAMRDVAKAEKAYAPFKQEKAKQDLADAQAKVDAIRKELEVAKKACEASKDSEEMGACKGKCTDDFCMEECDETGTEACRLAASLESELADAENQLEQTELDIEEADLFAEDADLLLGKPDIEEDHTGQEFRAFSSAVGSVEDATYMGNIDYTNTDDIFKTVTRRAARIIVGLKPIVYIFAGFGLIAFAFAAIFNKISWKWFANIAIGLFLVANMGRLIEYMVLNTKSGAPQAPEEVTEFGNHLHTYFADTEYAWVDVATEYTPPTDEAVENSGGTPDADVAVPQTPEEKAADERGFCEAENKGGGLFGGGGFMSCVKDLVASGKKVVDAAKKVKNTVDTVKTAVDVVTNAAQNIGEAVDKMGTGDIKQIIGAIGEIGNNVNTIVASGGNVIRNTMNNTSGIANDLQDVTKSREQQNSLRVRRDSGEATNAVDAAMQRQAWDKENKQVERDKKGNIKSTKKANKKGVVNNNGQTGFEDVVDKVTKGSQSVNNQLQGMKDNAYIGTQTVEGIMRSVGGGK